MTIYPNVFDPASRERLGSLHSAFAAAVSGMRPIDEILTNVFINRLIHNLASGLAASNPLFSMRDAAEGLFDRLYTACAEPTEANKKALAAYLNKLTGQPASSLPTLSTLATLCRLGAKDTKAATALTQLVRPYMPFLDKSQTVGPYEWKVIASGIQQLSHSEPLQTQWARAFASVITRDDFVTTGTNLMVSVLGRLAREKTEPTAADQQADSHARAVIARAIGAIIRQNLPPASLTGGRETSYQTATHGM